MAPRIYWSSWTKALDPKTKPKHYKKYASF